MNIFKNFGGSLIILHSALKFYGYIPRINAKKAEGDLEGERKEIAEATAAWANHIIKKFNVSFDVRGRENIPDGACVYIANHQGYADIIAILKGVEGKQTGFISKSELSKVPVLNKWVPAIRGIFISRGEARQSLKVIQEGAEYLKQGFSMVIFPEGTRSRGPKMGEFKSGSFKLATKALVPIVPVVINGTHKMYEDNDKIVKGLTATVTFLPPVKTEGLDRKELSALPLMVETMIREELERQLEEEKNI